MMASEAVVRPHELKLQIPDSLRELLDLHETSTHYLVRTFSGATLPRLKTEIVYPWQLMMGILDGPTDLTTERIRERERELRDDERKSIA